MLLKSSLFLLFFINICLNRMEFIFLLAGVLIIFNLLKNKNIVKNFKGLKLFFLFYGSTFIFQFLMNQEGEVLFKVFNIYITKEGLKGFLINFLRILNLLMISWLATEFKIFNKNFGKYQKIFENVICLVPEVMIAFKKRMRLKWFFRYILKQVKVKS
ncbi:MAG: hypothetical protein ACRCWN_03275 [Fusobacteriaceae bacterium]